jgi:hypothetical protein
MATVNLVVKSKMNGTLATIYLRFRQGRGIDITVPTYLTVAPKNWSNKTQTYKQRMITPEYSEELKEKQESELKALKEFVGKAHSSLKGDKPTKEWLSDTINKFEELQKPPKPLPDVETLNQYIERFISEAKSGKRLANVGTEKKRYSQGSLRTLGDFQHSFDLFQGIYKEPKRKKAKEGLKRLYKPLNFEDITIDFYNDWLTYFYERNCSPNYIGKHLKSLKTIMRQAREDGLHNNLEIERKAFKTISSEAFNIYLNEDELKKLYEFDLTDKKHLEVARDVFLVGCFTAQRYSDYSRITKDNIKTYSGATVIELIQKKTGEKCIIPIRPEVEAILKKYGNSLPLTHEQKVNDYIKIVGKLAGITDVIHYEQNRGGFTVKKKSIKADLIKTHTARRSGCTNMYLAKIPIISIMKISGHRTEKEFLKYIKVSKEETAVNLASHPYFIGNTLRVAK